MSNYNGLLDIIGTNKMSERQCYPHQPLLGPGGRQGPPGRRGRGRLQPPGRASHQQGGPGPRPGGRRLTGLTRPLPWDVAGLVFLQWVSGQKPSSGVELSAWM